MERPLILMFKSKTEKKKERKKRRANHCRNEKFLRIDFVKISGSCYRGGQTRHAIVTIRNNVHAERAYEYLKRIVNNAIS